MQKINVTVLRGGPSEEYEISLMTGKGVLDALQDSRYSARDIIITRKGEWLVDGFVRKPQDILALTDVVFIALHGAYGEDGTVQRILDRLNIPYTGSRAYPSAIAMNKMLTKEHLKDLGIKMAPHMRVSKADNTNVARIASTIESLFGPEYVIKPIAGGSSIGNRMAKGSGELSKALTSIFKTHTDVLVEERIFGKEATCAIIENFRDQRFYQLPIIEIVPPESADFFTTEVKYTGETEEICPGRFSETQKTKLGQIAETVHKTLGLSQYSRSDFIVTDNLPAQSGDIYFFEVNTLPGLTEHSLVPKSLAAVGCSYGDFIDHLLTDTLNR